MVAPKKIWCFTKLLTHPPPAGSLEVLTFDGLLASIIEETRTMKAVLDVKASSIYDDDIAEKYQLPKGYLEIIRKCIGDWVVFRRTGADGGDMAYFATARVLSVDPDVSSPGMYYARLGDYLDFLTVVPFKQAGRYAEKALRGVLPTEVGINLRGGSVRHLEESDFAEMISGGLPEFKKHVMESGMTSEVEFTRSLERALVSRITRDTDFRRKVCTAYENTCAFTRLKILDQNNNAEVEAAHILPVADMGPDVVQNGLALSSTVHWLFDRHLISISSDFQILMREKLIPPPYVALLNSTGGQLHFPQGIEQRPNQTYLAKHRELFETKNI